MKALLNGNPAEFMTIGGGGGNVAGVAGNTVNSTGAIPSPNSVSSFGSNFSAQKFMNILNLSAFAIQGIIQLIKGEPSFQQINADRLTMNVQSVHGLGRIAQYGNGTILQPPYTIQTQLSGSYNPLAGATAQVGGGSPTVKKALPIALTAASADGPLPIGDLIGAGIIAGAATYDYTHGNNKNNPNTHILYEIFGYRNGVRETIKYGISDYTKWGETRPKNQIPSLSLELASEGYTGLNYFILNKVKGRVIALGLEIKYVGDYVLIYGRMPRKQIRPIPFKK
ncbi:MAG: hypothetical protein R2760_07215 [Chitinophagales bacterium]